MKSKFINSKDVKRVSHFSHRFSAAGRTDIFCRIPLQPEAMKSGSDSTLLKQFPPYEFAFGTSSVLQCLQIMAFHLTISLHDGHSRYLPGTSFIGGNKITIKIDKQKIALKKNHPTALRPLLFASNAPIVPGIPKITRIIISSGAPMPNMRLPSLYNNE